MFTRLLMVAGALIVPIVLSVSSQVLAAAVPAPTLGDGGLAVTVTEVGTPPAEGGGSTSLGRPREILQDPRPAQPAVDSGSSQGADAVPSDQPAPDAATPADDLDDPADDIDDTDDSLDTDDSNDVTDSGADVDGDDDHE